MCDCTQQRSSNAINAQSSTNHVPLPPRETDALGNSPGKLGSSQPQTSRERNASVLRDSIRTLRRTPPSTCRESCRAPGLCASHPPDAFPKCILRPGGAQYKTARKYRSPFYRPYSVIRHTTRLVPTGDTSVWKGCLKSRRTSSSCTHSILAW